MPEDYCKKDPCNFNTEMLVSKVGQRMSNSWSTSSQPDFVRALCRRKTARNRQGKILFRKILMSIILVARTSGAGNGCANFMAPGKIAFFLQENLYAQKIPRLRGGVFFGSFGGGGVGSADFIFMSARIFLICCAQSCSKVGQLFVNSSPTLHPIGTCSGLPCNSPLATPEFLVSFRSSRKKNIREKFGKCFRRRATL